MITWGNPWSLRWTRLDGNLSVQTGASSRPHGPPARAASPRPTTLAVDSGHMAAQARRTRWRCVAVVDRWTAGGARSEAAARPWKRTADLAGWSPGAGSADERVHSIPVEWPEFPVTTGQLPDRTAWTDPQLVVRSGRHLAHSSPWI